MFERSRKQEDPRKLQRQKLDTHHPSLRDLDHQTSTIENTPLPSLREETQQHLVKALEDTYGYTYNPETTAPNEVCTVRAREQKEEEEKTGYILYPGFMGTGPGMAPVNIALFNEMKPDAVMSFASVASVVTADHPNYSTKILDQAAALAGYTVEAIQREGLTKVNILGGLSLGSQSAIAALPLIENMLKQAGSETEMSNVFLVCPSGIFQQNKLTEFLRGMYGYSMMDAEITARHPSYYDIFRIKQKVKIAKGLEKQEDIERYTSILEEMEYNKADITGLTPEQISTLEEIDKRLEELVRPGKQPDREVKALQKKRHDLLRAKIVKDTAGAETAQDYKQMTSFWNVAKQIMSSGITDGLPDRFRDIQANIAIVFSDGDPLFQGERAIVRLEQRQEREEAKLRKEKTYSDPKTIFNNSLLFRNARTLIVRVEKDRPYGHNSHGVTPRNFAKMISYLETKLAEFAQGDTPKEEYIVY